MNMSLLSQLDKLTAVQRATRDHFQEGGSVTAVLVVLVLLTGVILLTYNLARRQRGFSRAAAAKGDPHRLFRNVLDQLELTTPQYQWLQAVVKELKLEHPAVILLSPALFDRCAGHRHGDPRGPDSLQHSAKSFSGTPLSSPLVKGGKRGVERYTKTQNALRRLTLALRENNVLAGVAHASARADWILSS